MSARVKTQRTNVTIDLNGVVSGGVDTRNRTLIGLIVPNPMTGTTLTLEESSDGVTWSPVYKDDGNAYSITISASQQRAISLNKEITKFCKWVRIACSSQAAARTITLIMANVD